MPERPYHVQKLLDDRDTFPHHRSVSALWNVKWKKAASLGLYPFADGKIEDFEPIFESLIKSSNDDVDYLSRDDNHTKAFLPIGESLVSRAEDAEANNKFDEARDLYLRAATVYRIARFPINGLFGLSTKAWEEGKAAYLAAAPYLSPPDRQVEIPFLHASAEAGESTDQVIPALLTLPISHDPTVKALPVIIVIAGLDGYRTDQRDVCSEHANRGFACLTVEIPGTGDCPAARKDPTSPERLWSSVLEWISLNEGQYGFNTSQVIVRGLSTGGYYAMRVAHTHADRILAVVAQGGGSHEMFDESWIRAQNYMEYPFFLANAIAFKFGYESAEDYIADNPQKKFSLLENGIFDMDCTRLLLINGLDDTVFPIEDSLVALTRGRIKDARFVAGRPHMGEPEAGGMILDWIDEIIQGH